MVLETVLLFIASAVFVDFIGYWLHRLAHHPRSPLYGPHMTHHVVNYPPRSFFSSEYRSSRSDSLALWFAPFGALYVIAVLLLGLPHPWAIISGGATVAILSSLTHDLTHISGSIVWRRKWLLGIAVRHHTHHFKMRRNFGVLVPWWDDIFRTRRPHHENGAEGASLRRNRLRAR